MTIPLNKTVFPLTTMDITIQKQISLLHLCKKHGWVEFKKQSIYIYIIFF